MKLIKNCFFYFALTISLSLICIATYRAFSMGFTYDESLTYFLYIKNNTLSTVLSINDNLIPNNHLFNTILMSMIIDITKIRFSEFLLRLPNLISYILYFIFAYKFSKNNKNKYLLFSFLAFNYSLNEYASLARGYCMATTFIMLALYYFDIYIKTNDLKYINKIFYSFIISCYCNTICLLIYGTFFIIILFKLIRCSRIIEYIKSNILHLVLIFILSMFISIFHFLVTLTFEGYIYGGNSSFFIDTICSIFNMYGLFVKYYLSHGHIMYTSVYKYIIVLYSILTIIIITNIKKIKNNYYLYIYPICMIITLVLTTITKSMNLTGRLIIPFIPIFCIWLIEIINVLPEMKFHKTYKIIIIVLLIISFANNLSLKYTRDYNRDVIVKEEAYKAYKNKNNTIIKEYKYELKGDFLDGQPHFNFYKFKLLYEYGYDISK